MLAPSLTAEPYYVAARLVSAVREIARDRNDPRLEQIELHAALGLRILCTPKAPPLGDAGEMRAYCREIELALNSPEFRPKLDALIIDITQSPRDRMRNRVQGVPQLRRTRDDVVRRAQAVKRPVHIEAVA